MVKTGDVVIYKGRRATEYVGKKAKVLSVGSEIASLKFSDGHVYDYARVTNLVLASKKALKKAIAKKTVAKKVAKKAVSKVGVTKKTKVSKVKKTK